MNALLKMKNSIFPEDITKEVFKILPLKSVVRFRCVSKSWDSIITDPLFAKLHRCPTLGFLLYYKEYNIFKTINCEDYKIRDRELPEARSLRYREDYTVWGTCNGFVCFGYRVGSKIKLNMWNPFTGEVMMLPEVNDDISYGNTQFGLGWDKKTGDYKVVRLVFSNPASDVGTQLHVLSLKTMTWVTREDWVLNFGFCLTHSVCKMMYFDGTLQWQACNGNNGYCVIGFDLAEEKFQPHMYISTVGELGVISGNLSLTIHWKGTSDVWVLDGDRYNVKTRWTRVVNVDIKSNTKLGEPYADTCKLLSLSNDGEVIGYFKSTELFVDRIRRRIAPAAVVKLGRFNMSALDSFMTLTGIDIIKPIRGDPQAEQYAVTLASYIQWSVDRSKKRKRNKLQIHL